MTGSAPKALLLALARRNVKERYLFLASWPEFTNPSGHEPRFDDGPYRVSTAHSARNTRWIWRQVKCISLSNKRAQRNNDTLQLGINPRCARINSRRSSRSALLFLRSLKNSLRTLTTIALTLTPSASAQSLSASRASAPTWRSRGLESSMPACGSA